MNSRSYVGPIIFVAICGLLASIVLFPFYEQVSIMIADDGQYQAALRRYQKQLHSQASESLPAVVSTVRLLQENGRDREGIVLAEGYLVAHPDDPQALAFLAQLYSEAARDDEALEILQRQYALNPDEKTLRNIARTCEGLGHADCERKALELLVYHYRAQPREFHRLAYFYSAAGEFDKAIDVIHHLIQTTPPEKLSYIEASFAIRLLAYHGLPQEAAEVAGGFLSVPKNRPDYFDIVSIFADKGLPKQGLAVFSLLPKEMRDSSRGYETKLDLLLAAGEDQAAYSWLLEARSENKITTRLFSHALPLTLESAPNEFFMQLLQGLDLKDMPRDDLMDIAVRSVTRNEPNLAKLMEQRLGKEYLQTYPALLLALALGAGDFTEEQAAQRYNALFSSLTNPDNAVLSMLFELRGMSKLSQQALASIKTLNDFQPSQIFQLMTMLIGHKLDDQAMVLLKPYRENLSAPPLEVTASWMLLVAAQGNEKAVEHWLSVEQNVPSDVLHGIFDVAMERHFGSIALLSAQRLYQHWPTPLNSAYIASAEVISGQANKGLATLRTLFRKGVPIADQYISALAFLEKDHPELVPELTQVVQHELQDPRVSENELRHIGYLLVDAHLKQDAEPIFRRLAQGGTFASGDVQTLLDLWGERPKPAEAAWIVERASAAPANEEAQWLHHLVGAQQPHLVLDILKRSVNDVDSLPAIVDAHFQALVALKDKEAATQLITEMVVGETDIKRIKAWAKEAKDASFYEGAQTLFGRAVELDPENHGYWRDLGLIAFAKGDLCAAEHYLSYYLCLEEGDQNVYYAYAEILYHRKCWAESRCYYLATLDKLDQLGKWEISDEELEAHTYARLRCYAHAIILYEGLIERHPLLIGPYNDLAELLIQLDCFDYACAVLAEGFIAAADPKQPDDSPLGLIYLHITRLHLLRAVHDTCKALAYAEELAASCPCSPEILSALAELDIVCGRWRLGLSAADAALECDPCRTSTQDLIGAIIDDHRGFMTLGTEYRTSSSQHELLGRFHAEDYINPGQRLFVDLEIDHIHFGQFIPFNTGIATPFKGNRERGAVGIIQDLYTGPVIQGTLFFAEGIIGAGTKVGVPDCCGTTLFTAAYREPCWDLLESTIQQGVKHHIGIGRLQQVFPRIELAGTLNYNQYDLKINQKVATSFELLAGGVYQLSPLDTFVQWWGRGSQIGLSLTLEKEQVLSQLQKTNDQGTTYDPLGLSNREAWTGSMVVFKPFSDCWSMDGNVGYMYDRAASHGGATGAFGMTWGRKGCLQARLYYYHVVSSLSSSSAVDSIAFNIRYPF